MLLFSLVLVLVFCFFLKILYTFSRNVTKAFYSASLLFEVLTQFGELSDEVSLQKNVVLYQMFFLLKNKYILGNEAK